MYGIRVKNFGPSHRMWKSLTMDALYQFLEENKQRYEDELCEFLRIPSISTDSAYTEDVQKGAQWIADSLSQMGLNTELIATSRHPIVFAESPPKPGKPVVLIYGHYDVQPPDPLEEWISPPFVPTIRDGNVYARGATDDKGQMYTHIKAVEAWMRTVGELPVQVKFLIEGEEECGSGCLYEFLDGKYNGERTARDRIACDIAVISDSSQFAPGQPAITYGLKGICYYELRLSGPRQDLHSGQFGGAVTNPCNVIATMMGALKNEKGIIQIPGFYDDVIPLSDREREQFAQLPFDDEEFKKQIGVTGLTGEESYTTLERRWARPTCDVNGIWGGYQGEGAKTVLPAKANAKFSFRLVPHQDAVKIRESLEQMLADLCPPGIEMELVEIHSGNGVIVPLESPFMGAAEAAIENGFGVKPVFIREGGSIPVVASFKEKADVDTLLLGWGLTDDNTHSPNEKFHLADFHRGIKASASLLDEISKIES